MKGIDMSDLLNQFWEWAGKTLEEYAKYGMNQNKGEFEDEFPLFQDLLVRSREIIDNNLLDDFAIDELLTIMAIDNESESVLDYIKDNCLDEQVQKIAERGISHIQYNARWQVAELIYKRRIPGCKEYLARLANDEDSYVRRRASYCFENL